ncbi:MAG: hypothetical protein K6G50_13895 [bacterium]|nr:hypothetical protein [bacterium]
MNYTFNTLTKLSSCFKSEDYFPAIVQFSSEELNNRFVEFSYNDTDMFELIGSSKTGIIKQFTLALCNHFEEMDKPLIVPDAKEGTMILNKNDTVQCEKFIVLIYKDGLRIDLSEKEACNLLKCGQLVFAFDESDSLVSLYVTDLSADDISHILQEVYYE